MENKFKDYIASINTYEDVQNIVAYGAVKSNVQYELDCIGVYRAYKTEIDKLFEHAHSYPRSLTVKLLERYESYMNHECLSSYMDYQVLLAADIASHELIKEPKPEQVFDIIRVNLNPVNNLHELCTLLNTIETIHNRSEIYRSKAILTYDTFNALGDLLDSKHADLTNLPHWGEDDPDDESSSAHVYSWDKYHYLTYEQTILGREWVLVHRFNGN